MADNIDLWTADFDGRPLLNTDLVAQLGRAGSRTASDTSIAVALADLAHDDLVAKATHGNTSLTSKQLGIVLSALRQVLNRLGVQWTLPFRDHDSFEGYYRRENLTGSGSWSARRGRLHELFEPLRQELAHRVDVEGVDEVIDLEEPGPTWASLEEDIEQMRRHFRDARSRAGYRNVGNDAVHILEGLSAVAYDAAQQLRSGEVEPPVAQTKNRLTRVIEVETGSTSLADAVRALITLTQSVKHDPDSDRVKAGAAADAAVLVVNMVKRALQKEEA